MMRQIEKNNKWGEWEQIDETNKLYNVNLEILTKILLHNETNSESYIASHGHPDGWEKYDEKEFERHDWE